ncbi:MAG: exodeoxyribonuclease VII large subunit [Christensenellales bacterium]
MKLERILSVTQLNEYAATLMNFDPLLSKVRVAGEISNFVRHSSGHLYFALKDSEALIRCAMFKQNTAQLAFKPEEGMNVIAHGNVSVYKKEGQMQLYVQFLEQRGIGQLYEELERLKKKLSAEGLFDPEHKKKLPYLPKKIGMITSPTGAVIHDMLHILKRRCPVPVLLYPVAVQGGSAARETIAGLAYFNQRDDIDLIILGRGGGSAEDLWAYQNEELARAVFQSRIPVISAVGHETDFTLTDFAADLRAPTPSAAAELAVPVRDEMLEKIDAAQALLHRAVTSKITGLRQKLEALKGSRALHSPRQILLQRTQQVDHAADLLLRGIKAGFANKRQRFGLAMEKLEMLSPMNVLKRGYAIVRKNDQAVTSAAQLKPGETIVVSFFDGDAQSSVMRTRMVEHESTKE